MTTKTTNRIDVLDLFAYYNVEIVLRGEEAQFKCPFHNDRDPSASVNVITGLWWCYRCKIGGSPTDFVSRSEDWELSYADKWLRKRYGGFVKPKSLRKEVEMFIRKAKTTYYPENILKAYKNKTNYWDKRSISPEIVKKYELGYDPRTKRATIPIRSHDGHLLGVQGRTVERDVDAKYVFIHNFPKQRYLYGLHLIEEDWVVVVESAIATLKLAGYGIPCVSSLGSSISVEQAQVLNGFKKVYMLFDNDVPGWYGMLGNTEKRRFSSSAWARITGSKVYIPSSEDYGDIDDMTKEQVMSLLRTSLNAQIHVPLSTSKRLSGIFSHG